MRDNTSTFDAMQYSLGRSPVWPGLMVALAALAALALLLAFHQVVSGGVRQAADRQIAATTLANTAWRCQSLIDQGLREACLAPTLPATAKLAGDIVTAQAGTDSSFLSWVGFGH